MHVDVAVIGGGPGGSTLGALVKKYAPDLKVLVLERETFPRDHVGESQLPAISHVLYEMGCWDEVEAANFPIKIGATYCWGKSRELWDFDLIPVKMIVDLPRPSKFEGARQHLAFQVDRAIYDDILLQHAEKLGCDVRQAARVTKVLVTGDRVDGLEVEGLGVITANWYVDCSGHSGILRRAVGVEIDSPSALQNVAVWNYWRNASWAEEIGVGATRVQVMSVGYGWIWFIPLGPDRTSVGLVVPVEHLKASGKTLPQLYNQALAEQPRIASLMVDAKAEGDELTTKDWSFLAKRQYGENWFLVGESSGFADPILAAGLTITHAAAREAAYTIVEEHLGGDAEWLRQAYEERQFKRITSHIRFADYWYTANSQFTDLQEFTAQIAKDSGLDLSPAKAWAWIAQGGFIDEELTSGIAGFALPAIHDLGDYMGETQGVMTIESCNQFRALLDGATLETRASYKQGRVKQLPCYVRGGKIWPLQGRFEFWHKVLSEPISPSDIDLEIRAFAERVVPGNPKFQPQEIFLTKLSLESLIADGWVEGWSDPAFPALSPGRGIKMIHEHADV